MIHIYYQFQDGPWGGGNQFLKGLRNALRGKGLYSETLEGADTILVNSHHFGSIEECQHLLNYLSGHPSVKVIHRIDGPVTLIRNKNEGTDNIIFRFNELFADATIFQSQWCQDKCKELGWKNVNPSRIILNAPDSSIFYPGKNKKDIEGKIKIIATSWSPSSGKGFDVYQWMDQHIDWNRYEMTFVGNSPVKFKNIKIIPPQSSDCLADTIRQHDLFITASRQDPCSNSLIEALHCGLPALVFSDGGHPEIVGSGGLVFDTVNEIPEKLDRLSRDIETYTKYITLPEIEQVAAAYLEFSQKVIPVGKDKFSQNIADFTSVYKTYLKTKVPPPYRLIASRIKSFIKSLFR